MSKLLSMLIAAGFTCAVSGALAQDVTSEGQRAQGQEKQMEQKEQGVQHNQAGARERRTQDADRTQSGDNNTNSSQSSGSSQNDRSTSQSDEVPQQSMPSVGHPKEGAQTGQFGKKDMDQSGQSKPGSEPQTR